MAKVKKGRKRKAVPPGHAGPSQEDMQKVGEVGVPKAVEEMSVDDLLGMDVFGGINGSHVEKDDKSDSVASSDSDEEDIGMTKEDMEKLKETDPEFYEYLKETDQNLLDFDVDDSDESGGDGVEESEQPEVEDDTREVITSESLKSWCAAAEKNASLGAVRQMTRLYRIACHYGDDEDESLRLASSAVYNKILLFMLGKADGIFRKALSIEKGDEDVDVTASTRWPKLEVYIRSYLGNTLHLLGKVTDASMQSYVLERLRHSVIFLRDFDKIRRKLIALALKIFSSGEDEAKVQAILFIRALAIKLPALCLDSCLKGTYKSFASAAKFFNASSAPNIRFMASCAVEMYGIDLAATYQHAFVAIKDLASQMRQALTSKSKESYKEIYCWQTINCFELWATVLVTYPDQLEPLFYPVSQLLLGACTLIGSPSFIPLRLKCIRMLNEIAACNNLYIPVSSLLLEVLQWKDLGRKPKPVAANTVTDINLRLRVGSTILRAASFQEEVVDVVFELLSEHLAQWGYHPGFLEVSYVPLLRLRAFAKSADRDRFKRGAKQLCQAISSTNELVTKARNKSQFSPKDSGAIRKFAQDLEAEGPTAIVTLAKKLREQTIQRLQMRSMEDAVIAEEEDYSGGDDDDHDSEEEDEMRKRTRVSDDMPDNVDELENTPSSDGEDGFDGEDQVDVYQLSDDDE